MRANVELGILGVSAVYLAFFAWPVPKVIKDIYHTGIGRFVVLLAIAWLAKTQSIPIAILLAIAYVKFSYAAYHENFTEHLTLQQAAPDITNPTDAQKTAFAKAIQQGKSPEEAIAAARAAAQAPRVPQASPPPATSGNTPASAGSASGATAAEHFLNYAPVENF